MTRQLLFILFIFPTFLIVLGQTPDFVKHDSIIYPVHKANIGRIAFMKKPIAIEQFNEIDFLNTVEYDEKADLNIRVFLGNSLTNYLHLLSPQASSEYLTENGNYQFTFYVDDVKIYVENLNFSAGTAESKNQKTMFRVPLVSSTKEDSWGRFLWNRFYSEGGQDAFSEGEHILKIEIRPYLKLDTILTGNLIAEGELKIIIPEIKFDEKRVVFQTIKPIKDWQISTEKIDLAKIEELNQKIAKQTYKDITSIVAIKEGKIILEEYFNGAKRTTLHDTRSVGKSFASTLLGIAIDDKKIVSELQTLSDFYDLKSYQNYSSAKDSITLKSLLTMSSTFDGSDMNSESIGNEEKMYPSKNWVDFTLNLPVDNTKKPYKQWDYFTAGVIVLGDIIDKSVPNGLVKYSDKMLFKPLGITKYKWQLTPQKVGNTAGSLQLTSLDFAKFGQLYKNNGIWNGQQIVSQDWISKSLSHQIAISKDEYYGYLFWNKTYTVNGVDYEVYYSNGNGGNRIFIFKDQPIVIVITAKAYNKAYGEKQIEKMMQEYLIEALANK